MSTCIIIPSHIKNVERIKMLITCLQSLTSQTIKIPIYLSISFETELEKNLFNKFIEKNNLICDLLCIIYQETKTSQFRHIKKVIDNIKDIYNYIMFCDDDDTYENERVEKFLDRIQQCINVINCMEDKIFVGAYETESSNHSDKFHEYWSYCIDTQFIINFINLITQNNYDYYFDNKMCDVLFSSYLRHLDSRHIFTRIDEKLYNYNRNEYSITTQISRQNEINKKKIPKKENNFEIFIQGLNETLEENMESIKNNIFVKYSMRKLSFENILNELLKENYKYKNKINKKILEKIKVEYDDIKYLCDILYQYK
jgi:hypothetical protein